MQVQNKKKRYQIIIIAISLFLGCGLIGAGIDLGKIVTIILLGVACCIFSVVYLIICVCEWID